MRYWPSYKPQIRTQLSFLCCQFNCLSFSDRFALVIDFQELNWMTSELQLYSHCYWTFGIPLRRWFQQELLRGPFLLNSRPHKELNLSQKWKYCISSIIKSYQLCVRRDHSRSFCLKQQNRSNFTDLFHIIFHKLNMFNFFFICC